MKTFRQGDLLFIERKPETLPLDMEPHDNVLARGETTGHKHVASGQLQVFKKPHGPVFLQGSGQILHEEHKPISLPQGVWELRHQREYAPGTRIKQRPIAD